MRVLITLSVAAMLVGCVTAGTTGPLPIGKDTYTLTVSGGAGVKRHPALMADAIKQANAHCQSMGKTMVLQSKESEGAYGWTGIDESVVYKCE